MFEILILFGIGVIAGYAICWLVTEWKIQALVEHGDECGQIILKQSKRIQELEAEIDSLKELF